MLRLASDAVAGRDNPPPTLRRYTVMDSTIEKLGVMLAENPNGVLLFRDELVGFLRTLDKPGREGDRQAYLELWDGNGRIDCERIGRESVYVEGACLSLIGGVQPGPMASCVRQAASVNGADGLIARFQLMVWPDEPGPWRNVDRFPDSEAAVRAERIYRNLDALNPDDVEAIHDTGKPVAYLRFDEEAQGLFDEWREELENRKIRTSHENPLIEEHLSKYRSLMPSLALLFHLIEIADRGGVGPVPRGSVELAAAWCDLLECHARRVYSVACDADPFTAERLADRIRAGKVSSPFRIRDVVRHGWSGLDEIRDVEKAVNTLEDRGWVYGVEQPSGPRGGHPTVQYYINRRVQGGAK